MKGRRYISKRDERDQIERGEFRQERERREISSGHREFRINRGKAIWRER